MVLPPNVYEPPIAAFARQCDRFVSDPFHSSLSKLNNMRSVLLASHMFLKHVAFGYLPASHNMTVRSTTRHGVST